VQEYDRVFFTPPAPIAKVTLRNRENGVTVANVPMQIDSGADATLIPKTYICLLGVALSADENYELMGFDGHKSFAPVVYLDLILLNKTFKGKFLVIDQDIGILGRNILNHLSLLLDGPNLRWDGR
jgi:hypothetical protein